MRRTPTLTKQARERFLELYLADGFRPGITVPTIARETGMSEEQVRDAVFSPSADEWRREAARQMARPH